MVQTGSRTEQNQQNRFWFSSALGLSVRFSVLQKWLKNRTELIFGIASHVTIRLQYRSRECALS